MAYAYAVVCEASGNEGWSSLADIVRVVTLHDSLGGEIVLVDLEPSDAVIINALSEAATAKRVHEPNVSTTLSIEAWTF